MNLTSLPDTGDAAWFYTMAHEVLKERDPEWYAEYISDPSFFAFQARLEKNGVEKGMLYNAATSAFMRGFEEEDE